MLTKEQRDEIRARGEAMRKLHLTDTEAAYLYSYLTDVPALLDVLEEAEADRDAWRRRAKALERAVKKLGCRVPCVICEHKNTDICDDACGIDEPYDLWQFAGKDGE